MTDLANNPLLSPDADLIERRERDRRVALDESLLNRVTASRDEWKRKYEMVHAENVRLRAAVTRATRVIESKMQTGGAAPSKAMASRGTRPSPERMTADSPHGLDGGNRCGSLGCAPAKTDGATEPRESPRSGAACGDSRFLESRMRGERVE